MDKSPKDTEDSDGDDSDYLAGFDLDKEVEGYLENLQSIPIELLRAKDDEKTENTTNQNTEKSESSVYNVVKSTLEVNQAHEEKVNDNNYEKIDSEDDDDDNLYETTTKIQLATNLTIEKEDHTNSGLETISDNDLAGDDIESGEYYSSEEEGILNNSDPQVVDMDISDGEINEEYKDIRDKHKFNDIESLSITVSNALAYENTLNNPSKKTISKEEYERNKVILEEYYRKCELYMKQISRKEKKKKKSKNLKKIKSVIDLPGFTKSEHAKKDKVKHQKERERTCSKSPEKKRRSSHNKVKKSEHRYKLPEKINKKHKHYKKYVDYVKKEYKKKHIEHKKSVRKATKELEKHCSIGQNGAHLKKKDKLIPVLSFSEFCKSRELSPDAELQTVEVTKPENEIDVLDMDSRESVNIDTEPQNVHTQVTNDSDGELFVTYSDLVKQNAFDNDPRMKGLSVFQQALFKIRPIKGIPFLQDDHQEVNERIPPKKIIQTFLQPPKTQCNFETSEKKSTAHPLSQASGFHNKALSNIIGRALSSEKESAVKPASNQAPSASNKLARSRSRSPTLNRRKNSLSSLSKSSSKSPTRSRTPPRAYRRRRSRSRSRPRERKRHKSSSSPEFKHHVVYRALRSRKRSRSRSRNRRTSRTRSRSGDRHRSRTRFRSRDRNKSNTRSRSRPGNKSESRRTERSRSISRPRNKSRSRSRARYHCRSPKVHRSPPPEPDRRYNRRPKSPIKTFADQLRSKLRVENERALAMLRKTIDQAAVTCKNDQAAAKIASQDSSSTKVSSDNPSHKYDKRSSVNKKYSIFKPADLERLLPAEYSQISSCGTPSSRSEASLSPKHRIRSPPPAALPSPKIPDVSVPPPCITTAPPPVPTSTVSVLEKETEQIVVTTYTTNYVPFVSPATPNILPPAPGTLTPYINPELGQYQYNNYMMPHPNLPPPHMFPPHLMGRFDQPHFPFINQQQFHYPMRMPQFPNGPHNMFPSTVTTQPRNLSIIDISKQTVTKAGNVPLWPNNQSSTLNEISPNPQITWPQNVKKDQTLPNLLEAGLKKDKIFLDQAGSDMNKEQSFLNQLEGELTSGDTSGFKTMCCVHSHFKQSPNSNLKNSATKDEVKKVASSSVSDAHDVNDLENDSNKKTDDDCVIICDGDNTLKEENTHTTKRPIIIGDLDDEQITEGNKLGMLNTNSRKKIKITFKFKENPIKSVDFQDLENVFNHLTNEESDSENNKNSKKIQSNCLRENKSKVKEYKGPSSTSSDSLSDNVNVDMNVSNSTPTEQNFSEKDKKDCLKNIASCDESNERITGENSNGNADLNKIIKSNSDDGGVKVDIDAIECKDRNKSVKKESEISKNIVICTNTNAAIEEVKDMTQVKSTKDTNEFKGNNRCSQNNKFDQENERRTTENTEKKNTDSFSSRKDETEIMQTDSTNEKLLQFLEINSKDTVSQTKSKISDSNPSYKKKINLENKINKLIQVISSSSSSEDSKTVINNLVDNILADDQSKNIIKKSHSKSDISFENFENIDEKPEDVQDIEKKRKMDSSNVNLDINVIEKEQLFEQASIKETMSYKNNLKSNSGSGEMNSSKDGKSDVNIVTNKNANDIKNEINKLKNTINTNSEVSATQDNLSAKNEVKCNRMKVVKKIKGNASDPHKLAKNNEVIEQDEKRLCVLETEKVIEASLIDQSRNKNESNLVLSNLQKVKSRNKIKGVENSADANKIICIKKSIKDISKSEGQLSGEENSSVTRTTRGQSKEVTESDADENVRKSKERLCKSKEESTPKSNPRVLRNNNKTEIDNDENVSEENQINDVNEITGAKTNKRGRKKKVREGLEISTNESDQNKLERLVLDSENKVLSESELKNLPLVNPVEYTGLHADKKVMSQTLAPVIVVNQEMTVESVNRTPQTEFLNKDFDCEQTKINTGKDNQFKNKKVKTVRANKLAIVQNSPESDSLLVHSGVKHVNIQNKGDYNLLEKKDGSDDLLLTKCKRKTKGRQDDQCNQLKSNPKSLKITKILPKKIEDVDRTSSESNNSTVKINNCKEDLFHKNPKSDAPQNTFYFPKNKDLPQTSTSNFDLPIEKPSPLSKKSLYYITKHFSNQRAAEEEEHKSVVKGLQLKDLEVKLTRIDSTEYRTAVNPKASKKTARKSVGRPKRKTQNKKSKSAGKRRL